MFTQARGGYDKLRQQLEAQTRMFLMGSTPKEVLLATQLCDKYLTNCRSEDYQKESPKEVRLRPFVIDDHEVTNEEFAAFVQSVGYETDAEQRGYSMRIAGASSVKAPGRTWRRPGGRGTNHLRFPTHPVRYVSLNDARAFCNWSGGRVPTEPEWEYAARGEHRRQFPWGDRWQEDIVRWGGEAFTGPMPVRTFPRVATPEGVHDLSGNVWEWTETRGDRGSVLKGGSWASRNPTDLGSAARRIDDPEHGRTDYGFRCLWELETWP